MDNAAPAPDFELDLIDDVRDRVYLRPAGTGTGLDVWQYDQTMQALRRLSGAIILTCAALTIMPTQLQPRAVASSRSCFAYVANFGSDTVSVISVTSNSVVSTIAVGDGPEGVAITPDGTKAYVTNSLDDTVTVINTATNTTTSAIPTGGDPVGVAITPDGTRVYVANWGSGTVTVTNTATNTTTSAIPVGNNPYGIAITPDGTRVYVADADNVKVIDTTTNTTTSAIPTGGDPIGVAITPDGTRVYVANNLANTVTAINTATNTTTSAVNVGLQPYALAITPDGTRVYVTNDLSDTVSVIDATTSPPVVTATINVGVRPGGIAINCVTNQTPAPIVSLHHVNLDPNGGTCVTNGIATTTSVRTPFLGYSYIPGAEECTRPGFTFQGWAATTKPDTVIPLPLLRGWFDGIWRYFIANSYVLTAVWKPTG